MRHGAVFTLLQRGRIARWIGAGRFLFNPPRACPAVTRTKRHKRQRKVTDVHSCVQRCLRWQLGPLAFPCPVVSADEGAAEALRCGGVYGPRLRGSGRYT